MIRPALSALSLACALAFAAPSTAKAQWIVPGGGGFANPGFGFNNPGFGGGYGFVGNGGFYGGYGGYGGFPGYGPGFGGGFYSPYAYGPGIAPVPQTYNAMGPLMNSIRSATRGRRR